MRFIAVRIARLGVAAAAVAAVSACVPVERGTVAIGRVQTEAVGTRTVIVPEIIRADPEELAERSVIGGASGGMLGAGLAAIAAVDAGFGAMIGGPAGAVLGAAVGIATVRPLPSYASIPVPAEPVIPEFYDTWPPGYRSPPAGAQVPPPPPEPWLAANVPPPAAGAEVAPAIYRQAPAEAPPPPTSILPPSPP